MWFAVMQPVTAGAYTAAEIDLAAQTAAQTETTTRDVASDLYEGRANDTAASVAVQDYLISNLIPIASGLFPGQPGNDAYRQNFTFPNGTNILGLIPGRTLPNEYVVLGAHYDHLGANCTGPGVCSTIYNGATDNAAGVAVVLAIGRALRELPVAPRRSVILAFWDAEEDGLDGSEYFASTATVPLASIAAYLNWDIQGANVLPSLRDTTFAIGTESGGTQLTQATANATAAQFLTVPRLHMLFGQDRSDHASFYPRGVPSVFFTDSTGGCYHTPDDDETVVDFDKLSEQGQIGFRLTVALAEALTRPTYMTGSSISFIDAFLISLQLTASLQDLALFAPQDQAEIVTLEQDIRNIVLAGPGAFNGLSEFLVLSAALTFVDALTNTACDGYIIVPEPGIALSYLLGAAVVSAMARRRRLPTH